MKPFTALLMGAALLSAHPLHAGSKEDSQEAIATARRVMMTRPDKAARIGAGLADSLALQAEGRERVLALSRAHWIQAEASLRMDRIPIAKRHVQQAIGLAQRAGDQSARADALLTRGSIQQGERRPAEALHDYLEAARLYRAAGNARGNSIALQYLGGLYDEAADYDRARRYFREAGEAYRLDPRMNIALVNSLGSLAGKRGDNVEAARLYERALRLSDEAGDRLLGIQVGVNLAMTLEAMGNVEQAERVLGQVAKIARTVNEPLGEEYGIARALTMSAKGDQAGATAIIDGLRPAMRTVTGPRQQLYSESAYRIYKAAGRNADALVQLEALSAQRAEMTALTVSNKAALMSSQFDYAGQELKIAQMRAQSLRRRYEEERETSQRQWTLTIAAGVAAYVVVTLLTFAMITLRRSRDRERRANDELEIANGALEEALGEVQERAEAERRATMLAEHDTLTGLPNRRHLHKRLSAWLEEDARRSCVAMLLDLDRFKAVNDLNGHQTGDAVLLEVARRLGGIDIGRDSFIVRLGGDEFLMMLMGAHDGEECRRIADETLVSIAAPYDIAERRHQLGTSIGIARYPEDGDTVEQLIRAADVAMYEAKRSGRNTYRFYDAALDHDMRERAMIEDDLRIAVGAQEIETWFQPIVEIETREIRAFEALARWRHPTRGMIPPELFISVAEEAGLIEQITTIVLQQACRAAREWPEHIKVSVNMSPVMLRDSWIVAKTFGVLQQERLRPDRLVIEITENAVIDDIEFARNAIDAFRKSGIRVALDDFGCGYSSLSTLRELAFDDLKLDGSFVRDIAQGDSMKITTAVAGLAEAMHLTATAEGVENEETAEVLLELGFKYGQGYLYGRASPPEEAARLLQNEMRDEMREVA